MENAKKFILVGGTGLRISRGRARGAKCLELLLELTWKFPLSFCVMNAETSTFGKYQVIKIIDGFNISSDFEGLKKLIGGLSKKKPVFLAVVFTEDDQVSSSIISVLVHFYKEIGEKKGTLSLVAESASIRDIFSQLNLGKIFPIFTSLEEIPQ